MNDEIPSNKYRRIAKWVSFLSILMLLGLFISFGIPYPSLNKDVVHCLVGDEGEEFQLVSTYRKYFHIGMFFKDVSTRSSSSRYKIYFKSPNQFSCRRLESTLEYIWYKTADKKYCPYFGIKKNIPYMFDGGDIFLSQDGGKHFIERTEGVRLIPKTSHFGLDDRVIGGRRQTVDWTDIGSRALVNPPRLLIESAAFVTSAKCGETTFLFKNRKFCEQNEDKPVLVSRVESLDLGLNWKGPTITDQSELFTLTPIEAVPPLGDPSP